MLVYKNVENTDYYRAENVAFDINKELEYVHRFSKLKNDGLLLEDTKFDDSSWIFNIAGIEGKINFLNDLELERASKNSKLDKKHINLAHRVFVLELATQTSYTSLYSVNNLIKKYFAKEISKTVKNPNTATVIEFVQFTGIDSSMFEDIFEMAENYSKSEYDTRTLPEFEDIFEFMDILEDFRKTASEEMLLKYYPIILWWKITSIIPLRPSEFLVTSFECINTKDGFHYLTVKRSKGKSKCKEKISGYKLENYYKDDDIQIDESTYNLIEEYRELVKRLGIKTERLIIELRESSNMISCWRKVNKFIFESSKLYNTLNNFYVEVVYPNYTINSDTDVFSRKRLSPYHSRHIAIINLILLGHEPHVVMKLAGHTKINTTKGYYDHVEEYATCYALDYAKRINGSTITRNKMNRSNPALDTLNKLMPLTNERIKVDGGYCTYTSISMDKKPCVLVGGIHECCNYFISEDPNKLNQEISLIKNDIGSCMKVIKDLVNEKTSTEGFSEKYIVEITKLRNNMNLLANAESKKEVQ